MRISDWSSDVCSSDLPVERRDAVGGRLCDQQERPRGRCCGQQWLRFAARGTDGVSRRLPGRRRRGRGHAVDESRVLLELRLLGDRKCVVEGKSVSVRVVLGGRRIIKKKNKKKN